MYMYIYIYIHTHISEYQKGYLQGTLRSRGGEGLVARLSWRKDRLRYRVSGSNLRLVAIPDSAVGLRIGFRMQEVSGSNLRPGGVRGWFPPSLWRDTHPAIRGLRPPEHPRREFHPDQKDYSESNTK